MKQRKGKKYNPKKWLAHQVKKVMDSWCVCFMAGEDNCFVWNLDTGRELEAIDPELADVIILNRHKWRVQLYALCVDDFNVPYIKSDSLTVSESVTHGELLPYLNDAHSVLCSETRISGILCAQHGLLMPEIGRLISIKNCQGCCQRSRGAAGLCGARRKWRHEKGCFSVRPHWIYGDALARCGL